MATLRQAEERMMELLGRPDLDSPDRHQRVGFLLMAVGVLSKFAKQSKWGHLVGSFTVTVVPGQSEYVVPVDDFSGVWYAHNTEGGDLDVLNVPDADFYGLDGPESVWPVGEVRKLAVIGTGEDRRIRTFPPNAQGTVKVYYQVSTPSRADLTYEPQIFEEFQMDLLPAAAAMMALPHCHWRKLGSMEAEEAFKQSLLDPANDYSIKGLHDKLIGLYKEEVFNPNTAHPSKRLRGHGARRRRLRRRGVGY